MDRGANQESRWGGIAYGDDMLSVCITAGRRESIGMLVSVRMCQGREELGVLVCKTCRLSVVTVYTRIALCRAEVQVTYVISQQQWLW